MKKKYSTQYDLLKIFPATTSALVGDECECCKHTTATAKQFVQAQVRQKYSGAESRHRLCLTCGKFLGANPEDLRVAHIMYRRWYNQTQFGHLLQQIQRKPFRRPEVVHRFMELVSMDCVVPPAVLQATVDWVRSQAWP